MQEIVQLVSTVGFPIVFCLLMWKYFSEQNRHLEEVITDFKVTMLENNRLLTYLCNHLNVERKDENDA